MFLSSRKKIAHSESIPLSHAFAHCCYSEKFRAILYNKQCSLSMMDLLDARVRIIFMSVIKNAIALTDRLVRRY